MHLRQSFDPTTPQLASAHCNGLDTKAAGDITSEPVEQTSAPQSNFATNQRSVDPMQKKQTLPSGDRLVSQITTEATEDTILQLSDDADTTKGQTNPDSQKSRAEDQFEENRIKKEKESDDVFVNNMRGWLMTVATLLMQMAFEAGLNPPGGFWSSTQREHRSALQKHQTGTATLIPNTTSGTSCNCSNDLEEEPHVAGTPVLRQINLLRYVLFYAVDISAFGLSITLVIMLLYKKSITSLHRLLQVRSVIIYNIATIGVVYALGCASSWITIVASMVGILVSLLCGHFQVYSIRGIMQRLAAKIRKTTMQSGS